MIRIGSLKINSRSILAPMAGVSDLPYRMICRKHGCKFAFTEMISARGLYYKNTKTNRMLDIKKGDTPLGVQIMEKEDKFLPQVIEQLNSLDFSLLDFNAACPVKKVTKDGAGAALMKDRRQLKKILLALVKYSRFPVTVKIRSGWDRGDINARDIARLAEDSGIQAVFIHGRTRSQLYSGTVDTAIIRTVKTAVNIPVIASGDVFSPQSAARMLEVTGADGVLIARGSFGNPWIFRDMDIFIDKGIIPARANAREIADAMREHLRMIIDYYGPDHGPFIFRKIFVYYSKYFSGIKDLRHRIFIISSADEMYAIIDEFRKIAGRHLNQYN